MNYGFVGPVNWTRRRSSRCVSAFPPPPLPRRRLLSFGADVHPEELVYSARNSCAIDVIEHRVSQCWCLTGPQQPPIGGCEYIYLFLFLLAKVGRRNTFDTLQVLFVPRVKSSLTGWKFVYGNAMIEIRRGIVLLRVNI